MAPCVILSSFRVFFTTDLLQCRPKYGFEVNRDEQDGTVRTRMILVCH